MNFGFIKIKRVIFFALLAVLTGACANIVAPTGGPKDTAPPEAVSFNPENKSIHFSENTIKIKFNEYIELKNLDKELNIAPRLKHEADIKVLGKSIIIKIKDTLLPDKTYNFNFGNAVVDYTEGNVLNDFQYVFSTGGYIDSFSIEGVLVDAFTLKPMEDCHVALYENDVDSLPLTTVPDYVVKSRKDGSFRFNNLAKGRYKVFALKDANASYTYDLPNEWLGFGDTAVESYYNVFKNKDIKAKMDTIADSTRLDTFKHRKEERKPIQITMFQEKDSIQKLLKVNRMAPLGVQLYFKNAVDTVILTPLNRNFKHKWYITEYNNNRDSLYCWFIRPGDDSLYIKVADSATIFDTLELSMITKTSVSRGRGSSLPQRVGFFPNAINGGAKTYFEPLLLKSNIPLDSCNFSAIILKEDTIEVNPVIAFKDESVKRIIKITYPWKQKKKYELFIRDSVLFHFSGITNDTVKLKFTTTAVEDYGILLMNIQLPDTSNYILQLLSSQGDIVSSRYINNSEIQKFENVNPAKYSARLICDKNNNGKWDAGNYKKKIQPEKVYIYSGVIEIKPNWDFEADWIIKPVAK